MTRVRFHVWLGIVVAALLNPCSGMLNAQPPAKASEQSDPETRSPQDEEVLEDDLTSAGRSNNRADTPGDDSPEATVDQAASSQTGERPINVIGVDLPLAHFEGRPFRPIGVYQSQLVGLIPKDFLPVSLGELRQLVGQVRGQTQSKSQNRLLTAFYDVRLDDQLMISDRSELVFEYDMERGVRQDLGQVNLAIAPTRILGSGNQNIQGSQPHFEADADGRLIAVIPPKVDPFAGTNRFATSDDEATNATFAAPPNELDSEKQPRRSEIQFGWTLRGEAAGATRRFELRLPRSAQTRLVISVDSDVTLESRQGVLYERPGPPPDADVQSRAGDIRWYVLEAGGLSRVEIISRKRILESGRDALVVRRESKQYEIDLSSVRWTHRLSFEMPVRRDTMRLICPFGSISDVRLNSVDAEFQLLRRTDGQTIIDVKVPGKYPNANASMTAENGAAIRQSDSITDLLTLTVIGNSDWDLSSGKCLLPSVTPMDRNVYWSATATVARVTIKGPLEVARWQLPREWQQSVQVVRDSNDVVLLGEGPAIERRPQSRVSDDSLAWAVIGLSERKKRTAEHIWTRMSISEQPSRTLKATSRIHYRSSEPDLSPITLDVNRDWITDEVRVLPSGRRIDVGPKSRVISIWPTSTEANSQSIEIELTSHRNLLGNREELRVPRTWVVRSRDGLPSYLVGVDAPGRRRWNADAVLMPGRIESESLEETARDFFQPSAETLLLESTSGDVPTLELEPVDVTIGVALKHQIASEVGGVVETIVIRAVTSQSIEELAVLTGTAQRETFDWSLRRIDQSAIVSLPPSDIALPGSDPLGTYVINLEGRDLADFELIGRRFLETDEDVLQISLPSVRDDTSSQNAELLISEPWELVSVPEGVSLVPGDTADDDRVTGDANDFREVSQRLRYDPLLRPQIRIRRIPTDSRTCLVWKQNLEMIAGGRIEDLVHLSAEVSTRKPIRIVHEDDLELVSVFQNGHVPDFSESLGELWITPKRSTDRISLTLRRRHQSSGWFRSCRVPFVAIDGHVLDRRDSFAADPTALLLHVDRKGSETAVTFPKSDKNDDERTATRLFIMPRHIGLALGWLFALGLVQVSWMIAKYILIGIRILFTALVLAGSSSVIFWQWQLPILIWIAVPISLGALIHVLVDRRQIQQRNDEATQATAMRRSESDQPSVDFSIGIPLLFFSFGLVHLMFSSDPLLAQTIETSDQSSTAPKPIELLLPLDEEHRPIGDKVYLSKSDYEQIRDRVNPELAVESSFQSAEYRVLLEPSRENTRAIAAEVQADYRISTIREATKLQLPILADTIRRIEILAGDDAQIARFSLDSSKGVVVDTPRGREFRLRVTFVPNFSTASPDEMRTTSSTTAADRNSVNDAQGVVAELYALRLTIPIVHSASLIVEAPREIVVESTGNAFGKTVSRPELGRYEADLGPVGEISIRCHRERRNDFGRSQSLRRTYRLAAGVQSTIVECEIAPVSRAEIGQSISLTILGPPPTNLDPISWKLGARRSPESDSEDAANRVGVYQFIKQTDIASPIRLFWRLPSLLNDPTSTEDRKLLPVPEVMATSSGQPMETMFGIESAPAVRLTETTSSSTAVNSDEFLNRWAGYSGPPARAFLVEEDFPSFALWQDKDADASVVMQHHLHVDSETLTLTLKAVVIDPRPVTNRIVFEVPARFRLLRQSVNGENLAASNVVRLGNGRQGVSLGDRRIDGQMEIELICQSDLPRNGKINLPRFEVQGTFRPTINYRLTRSGDVRVSVNRPSNEPDLTIPKVGRRALLAEQIPVAEFGVDDAEDFVGQEAGSDQATSGIRSLNQWSLRVKRLRANAAFSCDQSSLMRFVDGQWVCSTLLELPPNGNPDFVDVEIPGAWARTVTVENADVWGCPRLRRLGR